MRERVLITGGSGFVGACLARALIADGCDVHLLLRPDYRNWRLQAIADAFTPHWADLRDAAAVRTAVKSARPEQIFHLATHGAYPTQKDRGTILATNLMGTANLLDALEGLDYRALVHAGSSSEYGHQPKPMQETDRLQPRTDYAVTKAAASLLCLAEAHRGKPVSVVRLFSAYGPWEEPTRLVPYVMGCYHRGEIPKVTAGQQPRDFIYVDDVVALLKIAAQTPAAVGEILHAGTGTESTVRTMIETVTEVCGKGVRPEYGTEPLRPDEPVHWVADIERTKQLTGWQPHHDLPSGVARMWDWYRSSSEVSRVKPIAA